MKLNRYPFRRNAAVLAAAAIVGALGIGGVVAAQADSGAGPDTTDQNNSSVEKSDGDGEANAGTEARETGETEETKDGPDKGPDANPNEPGHQDADEAGDGDGEQDDATEVGSDGETNDDARDTGPDADPNEPGHQDASDK